MRLNARTSAARHAWLMAIIAPHLTIDRAGTSVHMAAHRINAPRAIDTDVRWPCAYSVATCAARARSSSAGAIAASGPIEIPDDAFDPAVSVMQRARRR